MKFLDYGDLMADLTAYRTRLIALIHSSISCAEEDMSTKVLWVLATGWPSLSLPADKNKSKASDRKLYFITC